VEQLRLIMAELQVATVRGQVALSLFTDFENFSTFNPAGHHEQAVTAMLEQVINWSQAMRAVRERDQMGSMYRS
jgi:NAD(P)H-dependent FMN reductase